MKDQEYHRQYREKNRERLREYHKQWRQKDGHTLQIKAAIKDHYGCSNPACGWVGPLDPSQLDFHHIEGKSGDLGHTYRLPVVVAEINKCCCLCSNCHRLATYKNLDCSGFRRCRVGPDGRVLDTA